MMNETMPASGGAIAPAGETPPRSGAKLHLLGRRGGSPGPGSAEPALGALYEGGEVPFEDDEALIEEALAAEEAEAEASADEEQ